MSEKTYEILVAVGKAVRSNFHGWSNVAGYPVGRTFQAGDFTAKIVAKSVDPGYPANGYDDAYEQGTVFDAFIVVEVEGEFFKKTGSGDSYGEVSWDGDLLPAKVTEKVVQTYE